LREARRAALPVIVESAVEDGVDELPGGGEARLRRRRAGLAGGLRQPVAIQSAELA